MMCVCVSCLVSRRMCEWTRVRHSWWSIIDGYGNKSWAVFFVCVRVCERAIATYSRIVHHNLRWLSGHSFRTTHTLYSYFFFNRTIISSIFVLLPIFVWFSFPSDHFLDKSCNNRHSVDGQRRSESEIMYAMHAAVASNPFSVHTHTHVSSMANEILYIELYKDIL